MFNRPLRFIRDGALLGVLVYSVLYAAFLLHGSFTEQVTNPTANRLWDWAYGVVGSLGMMGVGYFLLGGALVGAIPLGVMFGKDEPRRGKAH